jgi:hypothetical protein
LQRHSWRQDFHLADLRGKHGKMEILPPPNPEFVADTKRLQANASGWKA